jgi:hypothetical protein
VIGNIAAAIDPMNADTLLVEFSFVPQQVFSVAAASKGVGVGVFQQQ